MKILILVFLLNATSTSTLPKNLFELETRSDNEIVMLIELMIQQCEHILNDDTASTDKRADYRSMKRLLYFLQIEQPVSTTKCERAKRDFFSDYAYVIQILLMAGVSNLISILMRLIKACHFMLSIKYLNG